MDTPTPETIFQKYNLDEIAKLSSAIYINKYLSETIKRIDSVLGTNYSDVTLGHKLRELNIGINNDDRFKSQHPSFYNINFSDCCDHITFHYIKEFDDMNDLYNTCK
jgi:hypothetical protein